MRRRGGPVAFVLSGGGSLGAVQVGMLRALYENGIVPDLLVAPSVGAVNAAFIPEEPRKLPKLDVAGSTPVARSREFEELARCR